MLPTFPVSVKSPALSPPLSVTLVKDFISGHLNLVSTESLRKTKTKEEISITPPEGIKVGTHEGTGPCD